MIEVSSGCTTSVGARDTTLPVAVTTRSTGIRPIASRHAAHRPAITQTVLRARSGTFPAMIAEDGDKNSRIAGSVVGSSCGRARLAAPAERRDKAEPLIFDMAVLLPPELAVDGATVDQHVVRPDIDCLPLVQHEDLLALDQGRQTMRDDHHRSVARYAKQVGVEQRLAFRIEGARRLVENENARIGDEARAIASRCRCPPERLGEPSSIRVS